MDTFVTCAREVRWQHRRGDRPNKTLHWTLLPRSCGSRDHDNDGERPLRRDEEASRRMRRRRCTSVRPTRQNTTCTGLEPTGHCRWWCSSTSTRRGNGLGRHHPNGDYRGHRPRHGAKKRRASGVSKHRLWWQWAWIYPGCANRSVCKEAHLGSGTWGREEGGTRWRRRLLRPRGGGGDGAEPAGSMGGVLVIWRRRWVSSQ